MKLYKLTDENGQTYNSTQWGENVTHSGNGIGDLCGPGYIHAYENPYIAVLMNPNHAGFKNPRLWVAEGEIALRDGQLKCGCVSLTTLYEIPLPYIVLEQRIEFAIRCALAVYYNTVFVSWANNWLMGLDRSERAAADAAERAAYAAADAAHAAAYAAADAAYAAAHAAADAAHAAADAAHAAAEYATEATDIDLFSLVNTVFCTKD